MLILRTLRWGPTNGYAIGRTIERISGDVLKIDHGSLYPALQRLIQEGWITTKIGTSRSNRTARFYSLTAAGRRQLDKETSRWERVVRAIRQVMRHVRQE